MSTEAIARIRSVRPGAPQLLLCHGVTDSAASLAGAHQHWQAAYDVTSLDARGHGNSPRFTPAQLGDPITVMVEDLLALLEHRRAHEPGVPRALIGHSMGGAVSAAAAAARPDLVGALIVEDPAWLTAAQAESYRAGSSALAEQMDQVAADPTRALSQNRQEYPAWEAQEACGWLQAKIQVDRDFLRTGRVAPRTPWQEIASALRVPTLVITSDGQDVLLGATRLKEIEAMANPGIRTALVPGASHCVRRDQAEGFYTVCDHFLQEALR